jgi:hypothetical protein
MFIEAEQTNDPSSVRRDTSLFWYSINVFINIALHKQRLLFGRVTFRSSGAWEFFVPFL